MGDLLRPRSSISMMTCDRPSGVPLITTLRVRLRTSARWTTSGRTVTAGCGYSSGRSRPIRGPSIGRDRAAVVVDPVVVDRGRLGRGDHDLVADPPSGGVVDGDRPVALRCAAPVRWVHAVFGVPWASSTPAPTTHRPTSVVERRVRVPPTKRLSSTSTNSIWWTTVGGGRTHRRAGRRRRRCRCDASRRLVAGSNIERPRGPMRTPATVASTSSSTGTSIDDGVASPGSPPPQVAGSLQRAAVRAAAGAASSTGASVVGRLVMRGGRRCRRSGRSRRVGVVAVGCVVARLRRRRSGRRARSSSDAVVRRRRRSGGRRGRRRPTSESSPSARDDRHPTAASPPNPAMTITSRRGYERFVGAGRRERADVSAIAEPRHCAAPAVAVAGERTTGAVRLARPYRAHPRKTQKAFESSLKRFDTDTNSTSEQFPDRSWFRTARRRRGRGARPPASGIVDQAEVAAHEDRAPTGERHEPRPGGGGRRDGRRSRPRWSAGPGRGAGGSPPASPPGTSSSHTAASTAGPRRRSRKIGEPVGRAASTASAR